MVAPIDVNKFIQEKSSEHVAELYAAIDKDVREFIHLMNLSLEDFGRNYILELGPTQLDKTHGGIVGMDLDMRPDTSTFRFVTHYRIRRKTDEEKAADDNRE